MEQSGSAETSRGRKDTERITILTKMREREGNSWERKDEMKSLMDICINWGKEGCHLDIRKWRYVQEIKENEEIPSQQEPNSYRIKFYPIFNWDSKDQNL